MPKVISGGVAKRNYKKKRATVRTAAQWNPALSTSIYKASQKIYDPVASVALNCVNPGTFTLLNGITQGDDYNNRDGRRTIIDSIEIEGRFAYSAASTTHPIDYARVIIFYDKQTNGTVPLQSDLLNTSDPDSFPSVNTQSRFDILYDRGFVLPYIPSVNESNTKFPSFKKKIWVKRGVQYAGVGATVASISTGAIYLFTMGGQVAAANNAICYTVCRVNFHD